jgi:hypothetical protein
MDSIGLGQVQWYALVLALLNYQKTRGNDKKTYKIPYGTPLSW